MGMYTELVLKAQVKDNVPGDVMAILYYLFNKPDDFDWFKTPTPVTPNHPFFQTGRWHLIGACSSYYHHPESVNSFVDGYIFSRSDLKNYDGEIEKFMDWVAPYLEDGCVGWKWYEEDEKPTLLFIKEGKWAHS